jgi:DNA-binding transcriptional LysR family regulator
LDVQVLDPAELRKIHQFLIDPRDGRSRRTEIGLGLYVSLSSGPLRKTLSNYMERFTGVEVRVIDGARYSLMERLNSGALDIIILTGQIPSGTHEVLPLWDEKVLVAVSEIHRLASQQLVTWDDLRHERIPFSNRDPGPELRDRLTAKLNGDGIQPTIVETSADRDTMISLVGCAARLRYAMRPTPASSIPAWSSGRYPKRMEICRRAISPAGIGAMIIRRCTSS